MKKTFVLCGLLALAAGKALGYSNVYYSAEDRKYMRIHQNFVSDIPVSVARGTVRTSSALAIRGYQLSDNTTLCQYLVHKTDQSIAVTGQFDTLSVPFDSGTGFWMSPSTGDTLARFTAVRGTQAVPIPDFYVDIALKITSSAAPAAEKLPSAGRMEILAQPNPLSHRTTLRLKGLPGRGEAWLTIVDIRGRVVADLGRNLGARDVVWNAGKSASGVYAAVLKCGQTVARKKLVLMK